MNVNHIVTQWGNNAVVAVWVWWRQAVDCDLVAGDQLRGVPGRAYHAGGRDEHHGRRPAAHQAVSPRLYEPWARRFADHYRPSLFVTALAYWLLQVRDAGEGLPDPAGHPGRGVAGV